MYATCDGSFVPEDVAAVLDDIAWRTRSNPDPPFEERKRQAQAQHREDVVVRALLTLAETVGTEERATAPAEYRGQPEEEPERLAREHGFTADRLNAFRGLARSRGVDLETVLRAALRGELRQVVTRPPVYVRPDDEARD